MKMEITDRMLWLLAMIESSPHVNGDTRLQKYALLCTKIVLKDEEKYEDWRPNNFGGFSRQVRLEIQYLTKHDIIKKNTVTSLGQEHSRYTITENGRELIKEFINSKKETYAKIKTITNFYFRRALNDLLTDTYTLFPEYTSNSKIKPIVRKTLLARAQNPNLQYVIPFTTKQPDLSVIDSTEQINEFQFQDEGMRQKLCDMIGLEKIPKIKSNSSNNLAGILKNMIVEDEVNAVEMVRSVRGHN